MVPPSQDQTVRLRCHVVIGFSARMISRAVFDSDGCRGNAGMANHSVALSLPDISFIRNQRTDLFLEIENLFELDDVRIIGRIVFRLVAGMLEIDLIFRNPDLDAGIRPTSGVFQSRG